MKIQRGVKNPYTQDTLDVWFIRDGLNLIYDSPAKTVTSILKEIGWRGNKLNREVVGFEDCIEYFLKRAEKFFNEGSYTFSDSMQVELAFLVDDMNAVLDELGFNIDFGTGSYVIYTTDAA